LSGGLGQLQWGLIQGTARSSYQQLVLSCSALHDDMSQGLGHEDDSHQ
jgi:hypothetical protein